MREVNTWQEAKKIAHLTDAEIEKAKDLGIRPEKIASMIPSKKELWKDPVALRIHRLYDEKHFKMDRGEINGP